jgi:hypothetical protein
LVIRKNTSSSADITNNDVLFFTWWKCKQNRIFVGYFPCAVLTRPIIWKCTFWSRVSQSLLVIDALRSYSFRRTAFSGRFISLTQRPLLDNTQYSQETVLQTAGLETTILESERSQTHIWDRAATGIDLLHFFPFKKLSPPQPRGVFYWLPRPMSASPTTPRLTLPTIWWRSYHYH